MVLRKETTLKKGLEKKGEGKEGGRRRLSGMRVRMKFRLLLKSQNQEGLMGSLNISEEIVFFPQRTPPTK